MASVLFSLCSKVLHLRVTVNSSPGAIRSLILRIKNELALIQVSHNYLRHISKSTLTLKRTMAELLQLPLSKLVTFAQD